MVHLIAHYLEQDGCRIHEHMKAFQNLSIKDAIKKAALARDENQKFYSHQWNLKMYPEAPKCAECILSKCISEIEVCQNFDALHNLIKDKLIGQAKGLGEMYYYDTSFRIGISMNIYPEKIYLHRGTRTGAKALGFNEKDKDILEKSEFETKYPEFEKLQPYQIEDFLCVKKKELPNFKRS
ncbi:MAG TPA: hypothetical protein VMG59_09460 [Phycisphaerae bacterium]|nr:hypothetical protein [Phycisphaerae bacterium]